LHRHCSAESQDFLIKSSVNGSPPDSVNGQKTESFTASGVGDISTRLTTDHHDGLINIEDANTDDDGFVSSRVCYAAHDCAMLCEARTPPEVEAYNLWYLAAQFPKGGGGQDAARAEEIMKDIESAYLGLRAASLADQKRVGREMVKEARSLAGKGAGV